MKGLIMRASVSLAFTSKKLKSVNKIERIMRTSFNQIVVIDPTTKNIIDPTTIIKRACRDLHINYEKVLKTYEIEIEKITLDADKLLGSTNYDIA